jgi:hypothetical protein
MPKKGCISGSASTDLFGGAASCFDVCTETDDYEEKVYSVYVTITPTTNCVEPGECFAQSNASASVFALLLAYFMIKI